MKTLKTLIKELKLKAEQQKKEIPALIGSATKHITAAANAQSKFSRIIAVTSVSQVVHRHCQQV